VCNVAGLTPVQHRHTRSRNSAACAWELYTAALLMQRGVWKQLSTMYLKFTDSGLEMFLGSVADVFMF